MCADVPEEVRTGLGSAAWWKATPGWLAGWGSPGCEFVCEHSEKQPDIGNDSGGLCGPAVGKLGYRRGIDIHAYQRNGGRQHISRRDGVEHRRDHEAKAHARKELPHLPLGFEHIDDGVGKWSIVANRSSEDIGNAVLDTRVHDSAFQYVACDCLS